MHVETVHVISFNFADLLVSAILVPLYLLNVNVKMQFKMIAERLLATFSIYHFSEYE